MLQNCSTNIRQQRPKEQLMKCFQKKENANSSLYIFNPFTLCQHSCIIFYLTIYMMYLTVLIKVAIKKYIHKFKRIISEN